MSELLELFKRIMSNLLFSPPVFVLFFLFMFLAMLFIAAVTVLQPLFVSVFLLEVVFMFTGKAHKSEFKHKRADVQKNW